jgi:hypothetical protein
MEMPDASDDVFSSRHAGNERSTSFSKVSERSRPHDIAFIVKEILG